MAILANLGGAELSGLDRTLIQQKYFSKNGHVAVDD